MMHGGTSAARDYYGTNFVDAPNFVPESERTLAERFSTAILPFPVKELSRIVNCSPETAKAWKAGIRIPYAPHLFPLARKIPSVNQWVRNEISPSTSMFARIALLQQQALMPGQEGAIARAQLNKIMEAASS